MAINSAKNLFIKSEDEPLWWHFESLGHNMSDLIIDLLTERLLKGCKEYQEYKTCVASLEVQKVKVKRLIEKHLKEHLKSSKR